jgi:hypothetical protein
MRGEGGSERRNWSGLCCGARFPSGLRITFSSFFLGVSMDGTSGRLWCGQKMKTNRHKTQKNKNDNAVTQGVDKWFKELTPQEQDFAFELWKMISQEKERRAVGLDARGDGLWARLAFFLKGRHGKRSGKLMAPTWCCN